MARGWPGLQGGRVEHRKLPRLVAAGRSATFGLFGGGSARIPSNVFGIPAFELNFADLGDGSVDLAPTRGDGVPTFTRGGIATTVDSRGRVKQVANNVARAYYDPSTLRYLGYLSEGTRQNLCLQSEDFTAAPWVRVQSTVAANTAVAPDDATTADKLFENTVNNQHYVTQTLAFANTPYIFSVFAKAAERQHIQLNIFDGVTSWFGRFRLTDGTVLNSAAGVTASITPAANGFWRCSITATPAATAAGNVACILAPDDISSTIYVGDGASGVYLWGAQLEQASFASTYIPTGAAAVTRSADFLRYSLGTWYNPLLGTLWAKAHSAAGDQTTDFARVLSLDNGGSDAIAFYHYSQARGSVVDGGVTQFAADFGAWGQNEDAKIALAFAANDFAGVANGGVVQIDTAGTIPVVNTLAVGCTGGGNTQLFGTVEHALYHNSRFPDDVLQAMTRG